MKKCQYPKNTVNPFSHMDRKGIKKYFRNYRTILKNCLFGQKNAILSNSAWVGGLSHIVDRERSG